MVRDDAVCSASLKTATAPTAAWGLRPGSRRGGIEEVVVFLDGNQVWTGRTTYERPRLADRYGQDHLHSAFSLRVRPWATPDVEILETIRRQGFEAIAVSRRGVASRLRIAYTPLEEEARTEVLPVSDGRGSRC